MPENSDLPKSRGLRLKPQFSLRTLLIVTLAAALFCAWWLTPKLEEKEIGGGALKVRSHWAVTDPTPANSSLPIASDEPYLHGRWILYDRQDRKLVDGRFVDGDAEGPWTYFDAEGRECLSGTARRGGIEGQWKWRDRNRALSQQISFTRRQYRDYSPARPPPLLPVPPGCFMSERTGTASQEWDNGQPRLTGQFANNQRAGKWTWFDRQGKKTAEGTYRGGNQQGPWRRWPEPDSPPVVEYFAAGKRIENLDALLAELAADLRSNDPPRRSRAAHQLETIGIAAVPLLREILGEGDVTQRLLAIRTIQHLGVVAAAAVGELKTAAGAEHPRVKTNALLALAETNPELAKNSVDQLLALATNDGYEHQRGVIDCLTRAGPAGVGQLITAVDHQEQKIRLVAFETIMRMQHERYWCEPVQGDPNVDINRLTEVIRGAQQHTDPKIRELAGPPPSPNPPGGGMF